MQPDAQKPTAASGPRQRKLRNLILDARFQLKFSGSVVGLTLIIVGLLGVFLYRTTNKLFAETGTAVEARFKAAETSKELGKATLANELVRNVGDEEFTKRLEEKSKAIDREYEVEAKAVQAARTELVGRQKLTLVALVSGLFAFVLFIGFAGIVATHRIVGPLLRIKRMTKDVIDGRLRPPSYGLRPGDELRDVFELHTTMIKVLRDREEQDLKRVDAALAIAKRSGANAELIGLLDELRAQIVRKLE